MNETVLVVGNGISRLAFTDDILSFKGEVWGCNLAFREFPTKLTRLSGHEFTLVEAEKLRKSAGFKYDIWAGPLSHKYEGWKEFTVAPNWRRDSGTTLVAQALHEGKKVICAGFDLGGPDVYCFDMYKQDKKQWVQRWVEIIREWGKENITFWGEDHHPYIDDVMNHRAKKDEYSTSYLALRPHLSDSSYMDEWLKHAKITRENNMRSMKVKYVKNGHIGYVKESVAKILLAKEKIKILGPVEEKREEPPKKDNKKAK